MKTHITEYLEITEAEHIGEYRISLHFNDGTKRVMDFGPFLRHAGNPEITAHRNLKKFKSFHLTPNRKKSASLSKRLLASLDDAADSPENEATWKHEALDRCAAFDGGQMAERDAADVLREAYRI